MKATDRRHFLKSSSLATLAALGASAPATSQAGQFTGKIRKAAKYHMVQDDSLSVEEKFRLLKDLGFDGTEVRTSLKDYSEIEAAIEKTGLPVHGVINSSNPDIVGAIDLAKRLGGTSVLVVARYDKQMSLQANWDRDLQNIKAAAPHAEKQGVHVLVENVWASYMISAFDYRAFLDAIDHPFVGSYFDVGNNVRWGVPSDWVELLGSRIKKLDIKEYSTKLQNDEGLREGFKVPIGEGSVDWPEVRAELAKLGFEGWATAEVPGGGRERLQTVAAEMDRVLDLA